MKRISNGDLGNMCGCSVDTGKIIDINSKLARMTIGKYLPYIQKQRWTGLFDCNVIISEQKVYFLEFCARLGYNCHPSFFMSLENRDCLNVMADLCDKTYKPDVNRGWAASVTIFTDHPHAGIPLNIPEDIKSKVYLFDGKKDGKNIVETGGSNELLIVGGYDYRIKDAIKNAYENCEKIDVINMDYRSDGLCDDYASSPIRRYQALMELGLL